MDQLNFSRILASDEVLRRTLDDGLPVDVRDEFGRTLLMIACRQGGLPQVELLIERGADVNARSPAGTTPIMYAKTAAFANGSTAILSLLLRRGADINAVDNHGLTALQYTTRNSSDLIIFLKQHGAL